MLKRLTIQNLAIVDKVEFEFKNGFNVFTGETGAGKSIIIDAISYLMGQTANDDSIKHNADYAMIEGVFDLTEVDMSLLSEHIHGFLEDGTQELIVYRKLSRTKSSIIRINNQTVTLKTLRGVVTPLIHMVSQHEHLALFNPATQLAYLDQSDARILPLKTEWSAAFTDYQVICAELESLLHTQSDSARRAEFLAFQIQDIAQHGFSSDEEATLETQKKTWQSLEKTRGRVEALARHLDQMGESLSLMTHELSLMPDKAQALSDMSDSLLVLRGIIDDHSLTIGKTLQDYAEIERLDIDLIEARLHLMFQVKTRYKVHTIPQLLEIEAGFQNELNRIENHEAMVADLEIRKQAAAVDLTALGQRLTQARETAALQLASAITVHLHELAMPNALLQIDVQTQSAFSASGLDQVQWLFSANPGEPPRPLTRIASGGELSRLMLAVRTVLSSTHQPAIYIFDEIDTGVGGLTAIKIGEKLHTISQKSQVFCVTHLPQIAKFASHHFVVHKSVNADTTITRVQRLKGTEIQDELQRMIGGDEVLALL